MWQHDHGRLDGGGQLDGIARPQGTRRGPGVRRPASAGPLRRGTGTKANESGEEKGRKSQAGQDVHAKNDRSIQGGPQRRSGRVRRPPRGEAWPFGPGTLAHPHFAVLGPRGLGLRCRRHWGYSYFFGSAKSGIRSHRARTPIRARARTRARTPIRARARTHPRRTRTPASSFRRRRRGWPRSRNSIRHRRRRRRRGVRRKRRKRSWISSRIRCCRRAARGMCRSRRPSGPGARAKT